ncbi:hypothetical protein [Streptomyces sp. NPDC006477]|uniref:hypothetical protein n=1 Tax=Streptomyces sp. NPDC006477 TaxID=3364747 RepID=UPI003683736A
MLDIQSMRDRGRDRDRGRRSRAAGAGRPAVLAVAPGGLASVDAYSLTSVLLTGAALTPAARPVAALSGRNDQP